MAAADAVALQPYHSVSQCILITGEDLEDALSRFEILEYEFHPKQLQRWAARFSEAHFRAKMRRILAAPDPVAEPVPAPFV